MSKEREIEKRAFEFFNDLCLRVDAFRLDECANDENTNKTRARIMSTLVAFTVYEMVRYVETADPRVIEDTMEVFNNELAVHFTNAKPILGTVAAVARNSRLSREHKRSE